MTFSIALTVETRLTQIPYCALSDITPKIKKVKEILENVRLWIETWAKISTGE